jgi:hypothetical protein
MVCERREQSAQHGLWTHFSDGVDTHIPLIGSALEGMSKAAGHIVLLEDKDTLTQLSQHGGSGHAPHARANDNGIKRTGWTAVFTPRGLGLAQLIAR